MTRKMPDAILFDVDGTLFETESVLDEAFNQSFQEAVERGIYTGRVPKVEEFHACLGMLLEDIWPKLTPEATEVAIDFINTRLADLEVEGLRNGKGRLFPGVKETLESLHKKGIRLFTASNGLEDYVKGVVKYCGLERFVERAYSAGELKTASKTDLVKFIIEEHQLENPWMVGDRSSDVEAGKGNGLFVVGCGFSTYKNPDELKDADVIISEFNEILSLL